MSRPEIEAFTEPPPTPEPDWMWSRGRTGIDQGPYNDRANRARRERPEGGSAFDR
jgi:hypothetical protein